MSLVIVAERPDTADAQMLIAELESYLAPMYPSESRHGYPVEKLIREGVAFYVMRYNEELAACIMRNDLHRAARMVRGGCPDAVKLGKQTRTHES